MTLNLYLRHVRISRRCLKAALSESGFISLNLFFSHSRTGVMRPKIAATLEGVNTNQLYKGPQAKLKKRPPKVCKVIIYNF